MKRTITFIAILMSISMLSSCGLFEQVNYDNVQRGMTKAEIIQQYGSPYAKSFYKNEEELTYRRFRYINYETSAVTLYHIRLENDTVVGMETELLPPPPKTTVVVKEVEKKQ